MHFGVTWEPTLINNLGNQVINCEQKTCDLRNCNVFIVLGFVCMYYLSFFNLCIHILIVARRGPKPCGNETEHSYLRKKLRKVFIPLRSEVSTE
jgi:hypothetical protein